MAAWVGPAIAAGGSIISSALGRRRTPGAVKMQNHYAAHLGKAQYEDFKQWADRGGSRARIQIAARDAKKAGLHPLFALGAGLSGGSPSYSINAGGMEGQSSSGSLVGDAVSAAGHAYDVYQQGKTQKAAQSLQERQVNSIVARNDAETQMILTQTALMKAKANATRPPVVEAVPAQTFADPSHARWRAGRPIDKEELTKAMDERAAMMAPSAERLELPFGIRWDTKRKSMGEALEQLYGDNPALWIPALMGLIEDGVFNLSNRIMRDVWEKR